MRKLARRAVIAGAGMLTITSCVGGAGLLGQAHADDPHCVVNVTVPCPQQADLPNPDPPRPPRIRVFCQPAGSAWGTHCFQRWVP